MATNRAAFRPPGACDKASHPSVFSPVRTFSTSSGVIPAKRLATVTFRLPAVIDGDDPSRRVWINGQIYPSCIYHKVINLSSEIWLGRGIGSENASLRCWRLIFETLTPTAEPADRRSEVVSGDRRGGTGWLRRLPVAPLAFGGVGTALPLRGASSRRGNPRGCPTAATRPLPCCWVSDTPTFLRRGPVARPSHGQDAHATKAPARRGGRAGSALPARRAPASWRLRKKR